MPSHGRKVKITCSHCKKKTELYAGSVNRAQKVGQGNLYCNRTCAGLARRKPAEACRTPKNPNWKELKAEYDRKYREERAELIKAKKKAYYAKTGPLNRDKEREIRKKKMPLHVEYCRQPEYRKKKKVYDQKNLAKKKYGAFAEAAIMLHQLETELNTHGTWQERQMDAGLFINKSTERKRQYGKRKTDRHSAKRFTVGYFERNQGRQGDAGTR